MFSSPLLLQIPSSMQMTDEQFFEFCQVNRDLRIERNKFGELLIMPPTGSETGNRAGNISGQLWVWSQYCSDKQGRQGKLLRQGRQKLNASLHFSPSY